LKESTNVASPRSDESSIEWLYVYDAFRTNEPSVRRTLACREL